MASIGGVGAIIAIEEHTIDGGLGGAVAETLLENGSIPGCFHRIGLRSGFSSIVGSQKYLRARYGMDPPAIVAIVKDKLASKAKRPSVVKTGQQVAA